MRHIIRIATSVLVALAVLVPGAAALASDGSPPDLSSDRLVVQFEDGTRGASMAEAHQRVDATVVDMIPALNTYVVEVPRGQRWLQLLRYRFRGDVISAEEDPIATVVEQPDDPYCDETRQWGLYQIGAQQAWDVTHSSADIRIAVLDTGIQSTHPDLADKVVAAADFTGSGTPEPTSNSHGTHVAGIAAASTNNGTGVAGLAWDASLMNARVMNDNGSGYYSWVAAGVVWATDNGADVINMSLGGSGNSSALRQAVDYAWDHGVVVVGAAGNYGSSSAFYPAAYDNCIGVAAAGPSEQLATWSNHGSWVSVAAPSYAYSTRLGSSYTTMQGTSMASPYVAGLAALVLEVATDDNGNGYLNDEVREAIESSCIDTGIDVIYGRIDAAAAVGTPPTPTTGDISGVVLDSATSSPIQGAFVSDGINTVVTDAQGAYALADLPAGTYSISASMVGYVTAMQDVSVTAGETTTADFLLEPEPSLNQPPVLDPIGDRVVGEGATLEFTVTASDPENDPLTFEIVQPPYGSTFVDQVFSWTPFVGQAGTYEVTFAVSDGELVDTETINITVNGLVLHGSIEGTVTDAITDLPIPGVTVRLGEIGERDVEASDAETTTDGNGYYVFYDVPVGSYVVSASMEGYLPDEKPGEVVVGQTTVVDFTLESEAAPNHAPEFEPIGDKETAEGEPLEFTVNATDPDDDPLSYVAVGLPLGATFEGQTFSWTPIIGQADLYGVTFIVSDGELSDTEAITILVDAAPLPGSIEGAVSDEQSGLPIAGATVRIGEIGQRGVDGPVDASDAETTTDGNGYYVFSDVAPSSYLVSAEMDGYFPDDRSALVMAGETTIVDFALEPEPTPNQPPEMEPIGDREVDEQETLEFDVVASDPDGDPLVYEASGLPEGASFEERNFSWTPEIGQAGEYDVTFVVSDGELEDSETITITVVALPRTGTVEGVIADAETGEPIEGALVSNGESEAVTDENGRFMLDNVPAGAQNLVASAEGYEDSYEEIEVLPGESVDVDIFLSPIAPPTDAMWVDSIDPVLRTNGNLRIGVLVVDPDPVRGARVTLTLTKDGETVLTQTRSTSRRGLVYYRLPQAAPGHYVVTVQEVIHSDSQWDPSQGVVSSSVDVPADNAMWVDSINLRPTRRGALVSTVRVVGPERIGGATVTLEFTRDGELVATETGETSRLGTARFILWNTEHGEYVATIVALEHSDYEWDMSQGVVSETVLV